MIMVGGVAAGGWRGRRLAYGCAIAAVMVLASACAESSDNYGDFQAKARQTAKELVSALQTADLAAGALLAHRLTGAAADVVVSQAEQDATSAQNTFDSRQPPDSRSVALKNHVDDPLQQATSGLTQLRIAVRRGDPAAIKQAAHALQAPLDVLKKVGS
jgi:HPt (histidine-containing phosphotransfer) domain-containing protein